MKTKILIAVVISAIVYVCTILSMIKALGLEEDEYQINTILHGLNLKKEIYKKRENKVEEDRYNTQYNWLKSFKDKYKDVVIFPTFTFDDILALKCCMKEVEKEEELYNQLQSLYNRVHDAYWRNREEEQKETLCDKCRREQPDTCCELY